MRHPNGQIEPGSPRARSARAIARLLCLPALALALSACGDDSPTAPDAPQRFVEVTAGAEHTCAATADRDVWCWGRARMGRLGFLSSVSPCTDDGRACLEPVPVGGGPLRDVDAGEEHNCALSGGVAYCWGFDWRGQLGVGETTTQRCGEVNPLLCSTAPLPVVLGNYVVDVTAGGSHSCALDDNGRAYCWGLARMFQLGDGLDHDSTSIPSPVAGGHVFTQITAGASHTCAIDADADAWCWGANLDGRLGTGSTVARATPHRVRGDPNDPDPVRQAGLKWALLDAGVAHTCGIDTGGVGWCFGRGDRGRIGNGEGLARTFPVPVATPRPLMDISAGETHSCALTADGEAWCWGGNESGQLGDGTLVDRLVPARVDTTLRFRQISAGWFHTCGLAEGGGVYCWGRNSWGQLGLGDTGARLTPQRII